MFVNESKFGKKRRIERFGCRLTTGYLAPTTNLASCLLQLAELMKDLKSKIALFVFKV